MKKDLLKFIIILILFNSCQTTSDIPKNYPRMIGDISFDVEIDNAEFSLCNDESMAVQYYIFTKMVGGKPFLNEKYDVSEVFETNYNPKIAKEESGLLRIRFLVNCHGKSGWYRMLGMNENYKEIEFDKSITNQILSITKNLIKWKPFIIDNLQRDYYMYLIFKIEKGKIIEILP